MKMALSKSHAGKKSGKSTLPPLKSIPLTPLGGHMSGCEYDAGVLFCFVFVSFCEWQ